VCDINTMKHRFWATEPSVQLDLESGTIWRRTSDSRTCHPAVSGSRFHLDSGFKAQCQSLFNSDLENTLTYLLAKHHFSLSEAV